MDAPAALRHVVLRELHALQGALRRSVRWAARPKMARRTPHPPRPRPLTA